MGAGPASLPLFRCHRGGAGRPRHASSATDPRAALRQHVHTVSGVNPMSHSIPFEPGFRRHIGLTLQATAPEPSHTPPFLILFVNSICNLTCEHCFYWRNLNRRDDLTLE